MSRQVRLAAGASAAGLAAQYLPSVATLGQWSSLRTVPAELCRWQGPPRPMVALTFDDGPDPRTTPEVLDRLDQLGLRATFFVLGSDAEAHAEVVAETARRGHLVGTHGYAHEHHLLRSPRWVLHDLRRAKEVMDAIGFPVTWYRPTYGQVTGSTLAMAKGLGLRTVIWSAWGREWTTTDSDEVARRLIGRLTPGAIALLHDTDQHGTEGMWKVGLGALPAVAEHLRTEGLAAVTLDELTAA